MAVQWLDDPSSWNRSLPAAMVLCSGTGHDLRALARDFVADALSISPQLVKIEHRPNRPPTVAQPACSGLHLSTTRRGPFAGVALAMSPVGIDAEIVDAGGEIPWNVLHPAETAMLEATSGLGAKGGPSQAMAFARLWSLKEAYLKALGVGLWREPARFFVRFIDEQQAAIEDPDLSVQLVEARTTWRAGAGMRAAMSVVVLAPPLLEDALVLKRCRRWKGRALRQAS